MKQDWKAGELALTYNRTEPDGRRVTHPEVMTAELRKYYGDDIEVREVAIVVGLSRANQVRSVFRVGTGGCAGCLIDPKLVFARLLLDNCAAFILSHNHPSGNHSPSLSDRKLTQQFVTVGNALDLTMLDHLIITEGGFYSFATSSGLIK